MAHPRLVFRDGWIRATHRENPQVRQQEEGVREWLGMALNPRAEWWGSRERHDAGRSSTQEEGTLERDVWLKKFGSSLW